MCHFVPLLHRCGCMAGVEKTFCQKAKDAVKAGSDALTSPCPDIKRQEPRQSLVMCKACHHMKWVAPLVREWNDRWHALVTDPLHGGPQDASQHLAEHFARAKQDAERNIEAEARKLWRATADPQDPRDIYQDFPPWMREQVSMAWKELLAIDGLMKLSRGGTSAPRNNGIDQTVSEKSGTKASVLPTPRWAATLAARTAAVPTFSTKSGSEKHL